MEHTYNNIWEVEVEGQDFKAILSYIVNSGQPEPPEAVTNDKTGKETSSLLVEHICNLSTWEADAGGSLSLRPDSVSQRDKGKNKQLTELMCIVEDDFETFDAPVSTS